MKKAPSTLNEIVDSPNCVFKAELSYVSEIRSGGRYYSLRVGGHDFCERIFGDDAIWAEDDRFLAIQEWHNTVE